jgi:tripartite-type tricarboxylate transporter receptor subunit TctC
VRLPRRTFLQIAGAAAFASACPHIGAAQTYPSRPITMIVPFPPGGPTDAIGRVVAERMSRTLGQPIVIENVSGADGSIGIGRAARAKPDGYTISLGHRNQHVLNAAFYSLPYDVLHDFAPIAAMVKAPQFIYATKDLPANNLKELIDWAKTNPGKATVGVYLVSTRLLMAVLEKESGAQFTLVPYRGAAPAMQDLLAGQIDLIIDTPIYLPMVRAGSIKALAVGSNARWPSAPEVPTYGEMGLPAFVSSPGWFGLFAPGDTPGEIVNKLNAAAVEALADPAVRSHLADFGTEPFPPEQQTQQALGALVKAEAKTWWPIIKEFGIKVE